AIRQDGGAERDLNGADADVIAALSVAAEEVGGRDREGEVAFGGKCASECAACAEGQSIRQRARSYGEGKGRGAAAGGDRLVVRGADGASGERRGVNGD